MLDESGKELPPHRELNLRVFVKENGKWLMAAFHNTAVATPPTSPHPVGGTGSQPAQGYVFDRRAGIETAPLGHGDLGPSPDRLLHAPSTWLDLFRTGTDLEIRNRIMDPRR